MEINEHGNIYIFYYLYSIEMILSRFSGIWYMRVSNKRSKTCLEAEEECIHCIL